jgi:hypothetical protein
MANKLEFPGGKIESDETPEQALIRRFAVFSLNQLHKKGAELCAFVFLSALSSDGHGTKNKGAEFCAFFMELIQ